MKSKRKLAYEVFSRHSVSVVLYNTFILLNHIVRRCLGETETFPGAPLSQNHFHNNIKLLFIFTVLTFVLMLQK